MRRVVVKSELWPLEDGRVRWECTVLDGTGRHLEGVAANSTGAYEAISAELVRRFPEAEVREKRIVRGPTDEEMAFLTETIEQARALRNRLLMVALALGPGMFLGREAASRAVAGGLDLWLAYSEKTLCALSHAEGVHDATTAVEEAVLAFSDPPTPRELADVFVQGVRLCDVCAAACGQTP
jgi:hypothetical protein